MTAYITTPEQHAQIDEGFGDACYAQAGHAQSGGRFGRGYWRGDEAATAQQPATH